MKIEDIDVGMVCNVIGRGDESFVVVKVDRSNKTVTLREPNSSLSVALPGMLIQKHINCVHEEDVSENTNLIRSADGAKIVEINRMLTFKAGCERHLVYAKYVVLYLREYFNDLYTSRSTRDLARFAEYIGSVVYDVEQHYPNYNEANGFLTKSEVNMIIGVLTDEWFDRITFVMCVVAREAALIYKDAVDALFEYREANMHRIQHNMMGSADYNYWVNYVNFKVHEDSSVCFGSQRFGAVIDKLCLKKNVPGLNIDAYIKQQGLSIREIDYAYYVLLQILSIIDENIVQLDVLGDITRFACDVSSVISGCELKLSPNKDLVKSLKVYEADTIIEYLLSVRRNTTENSILHCGIDEYIDKCINLIKQKRDEYATDFDRLCLSKSVSPSSVYEMIDDAIRTEGLSKKEVDKVVDGLCKLWSKLQPGDISLEHDVDYMISAVRVYFTAEKSMGTAKADLIFKFMLNQYANCEDMKPAKLDLDIKVVIYDETVNREGIENSIKATFGEDIAIIHMPSDISYDTALYLVRDNLASRGIVGDKVVFLSGNVKARHLAKSFGFSAMSVK